MRRTVEPWSQQCDFIARIDPAAIPRHGDVVRMQGCTRGAMKVLKDGWAAASPQIQGCVHYSFQLLELCEKYWRRQSGEERAGYPEVEGKVAEEK